MSETLSPPSEVTISMRQHAGDPCEPVVKRGEKVFVGTLIGDSDKRNSAPVHSSLSGKVREIKQVPLPDGSFCGAVVIESDGKCAVDPQIKPPEISSKEDFINAVRNSGIVEPTGEGFPLHLKLDHPEDAKIDLLIINAVECEPYITSDYREIIENTAEILDGILAVTKYLDIPQTVIGIENNKPAAVRLLKSLVRNHSDKISVHVLKSRYPKGAEKILIAECTKRTVSAEKLPKDVGCIVMNVSPVSFLSSYLKTGIPIVSKRITVDGNAVAQPKNVIAPVGTQIKELIAFCGGYSSEPQKIISGGPMTGITLTDDEGFLLKHNNAVLAFDREIAVHAEPTGCIRCGRCVRACPMSLMPTWLDRLLLTGKIDKLKKESVLSCMECGCCAYVCPAHRHLVQSIRLAKEEVLHHGE